ncbi:TPA: hypothetical protein ACH3X3_002319 [Trebouxia sp. C0006]
MSMDSTELQRIPRVSVKALQAQSHPTDVWELASENLTLSMCRHNVCVLQLPAGPSSELNKLFDRLDDLLQVSASASGSSSQPLAAGEDEPGLLLLPGRHSYNFKLGSSKGDSLSPTQSTCFHQAYTDLDNIARLALAAICRSCHVRLRSDTFAGILDDSPTLRGVVSSSTLHAMQHINNFLLRDKLGDKWTMAVSEEGLKSKGFMTVIAARDTRAAGNVPHVCKMQVKDALGSWKDVRLGPHEVAIMFGQTATQASAGLFRPAIYRVVGELYSSCHGNQVHTGRQSVAYHLNARPSAVLNFHDILEEAGHCVPDRYTQPVCMKDLLQRFDTVLTPPSMFKPAAARSIQLGTIDAAAAKKKRKRQVTPVSSPVTRSGRVRRSTAGLLGEPAHAKSSHANEAQKRGDFAAMVQAMRVYLTVDGNTSCPTDFLPIGISHYQTMNMVTSRCPLFD